MTPYSGVVLNVGKTILLLISSNVSSIIISLSTLKPCPPSLQQPPGLCQAHLCCCFLSPEVFFLPSSFLGWTLVFP